MSLTYGFYNSIDHDRVYDAEQMCAIFDGVINDGVFMGIGGAMVVYPTTGMSVKVSSGRAWFDRTWTLLDADYPVEIEVSEVSLNRIDAIVLEVNHNEDVRENSIKVVKGTPATNPTKPTLIRSAKVSQHALAYVTVNAGVFALTKGMIQNVVGTEETPFVTSILKTTDVTYLMDQWEDEFRKWFNDAKGTLDEDSAGHLLNKIGELREYTDGRLEDIEGDMLLIKSNKARMKITVVTATSETPISGLLINGLSDTHGNPVYTNSEGTASGFVTEGSVTLSVTGYADIQDYSATYQVYKATDYAYTWKVTTVNFRSWTSSGTTKLSSNVLEDGLDVSVGGAGGGGGTYAGYYGDAGGGGGGGYTTTKTEVSFTPGVSIAYTVGSGGSAGAVVGSYGGTRTGGSGGSSSFLGVSASGGGGGGSGSHYDSPGYGGSGNGNGGRGAYMILTPSGQTYRDTQYSGENGSSGTGTVFSSFTGTRSWGGGGGGGAFAGDGTSVGVGPGSGGITSGGSGGGNGGSGCSFTRYYQSGNSAGSGSYGGGGGGGGSYYVSGSSDRSGMYSASAGSGGSGIVTIRMRLRGT